MVINKLANANELIVLNKLDFDENCFVQFIHLLLLFNILQSLLMSVLSV